MSIENARPFDPNNRPLKGEWIHVTSESETATVPALDQGVDSSLTQGHDVVQRQPQAKKFPVVWALIAVIVLLAVIGFALSKGTAGAKEPASGSTSSAEVVSEAPASSSASTGTGASDLQHTEADDSKSKGQKEENPSGSN